ncbi:serine/threonine-protein kinase VRK1 [Rhipicephalus sanguineus]|uniref:Protein kinase domain-containing protein n=1 Tax=Rhipicephalus sanguineus TaxID=34632 RepID=A0A9D4YPH3_RHISA|nr:serine/threonine-protein kinase VRK1 [Rhipicephalus sanguineus]KAH7983355.1 hypothetical protein HPB52_011375 [Rhipicephalus sanguineus]
MSRFRCSEPNEYNGAKYRFMATDMFGEVLQKILDRRGKMPASKTTPSLDMLLIDVLERVHSYEPIHADVKAYRRLLMFSEGGDNRVYLLDFSLACRYTQNSKHKEYKEDFRKACDGTTEFTRRDADIGVHSRRADMELLEYNLLRWLCCPLPWEDNLKDREYVSQQRCTLLENFPLLMRKCFQQGDIPCGITVFLQYVASMKFEDTPDYGQLNRILEKEIEAPALEPDSRLLRTPPRRPRRSSFSPKKSVLEEIILAEDSMDVRVNENLVEEPPPANVAHGCTTPLQKNNRRSPTATKSATRLQGLVKVEPE